MIRRRRHLRDPERKLRFRRWRVVVSVTDYPLDDMDDFYPARLLFDQLLDRTNLPNGVCAEVVEAEIVKQE